MEACSWRCVVLLLTSFALSEERALDDLTTSAPSTPRPELVGIRGYRRFHANDSLIGQSIQCSHEEKLCFQYNLLYNKDDNGCYGVGHRLNYQGAINVGKLHTFENGSRLLNGGRYNDLCLGYRMAFDAICYKYNVVEKYVCGCNSQPTWHILGGMECRCTPPTPRLVHQPTEEGKCRIPDLRFPEEDRFHYFQNDVQGFKVEDDRVQTFTSRFVCSAEQEECFSRNQAWLPQGQGCFSLLQKGPCADEHVVALDLSAALRGRAEGACVHVQGGCPQGHVRMTFDGQCHNENDVAIIVAGKLVRDQFGMFVAIPRFIPDLVFTLLRNELLFDLHASEVRESCAVTVKFIEFVPTTRTPLNPYCGLNNKNECARYEAIADIPEPDIEL